ncbi:MAG: hypothetical protein HON70_14885, partial [Lentisphaerae bacterium]|nr:hypothetical protein [Lentisphaerota bacterium]
MAPSVLTVLVGGTIVAIVALGWLVPLIIGIVRSIKGQRSPGLIIFGALWGSVGLFFGFIAVFGLFAYRGAKAHTDVKPFDAVQAGDQVATLTVPFEGDVELRFVSEAGDETQTYTTKGEAGAVPVPAGEITPISLILTGPDEDGKTWTASTFLKGRRRKPRTLAAGESQDLSIGPPFEARVA